MNTVVSEKGQVTIPKEVRDKLGLRTGTVLKFRAVNGKLVASKQGGETDVFEKWRGRCKLPWGKNVDEYLKIARDGNRR
jgi:AbrB family looped-hinge helix DNA binding protein